MPACVNKIFPKGFGVNNAGTNGGLTIRPAGFTYDEIVKILYRAKYYRLQLSMQGGLVGGTQGNTFNYVCDVNIKAGANFTGTLATGTAPFFTPTNDVITDEGKLVLYDHPTPSGIFGAASWGPANFGFNAVGPFDLLAFYRFVVQAQNLIINGLYYPFFNARVPNTLQPYLSIGFNQGGASTSLQSGNLFGKTVQCQVGTLLAATLSVSSFFFSFDFLETGQGYWPYDPGDGGGPIYDEDDGTILRTPIPPL